QTITKARGPRPSGESTERAFPPTGRFEFDNGCGKTRRRLSARQDDDRRERRRDEMLSGEALDLAFALRAQVGPLSQADGPAPAKLREVTGLPQAEFERALAELEGVGFVAIDRRSAPDVAIVVLPPLQV